MRWLVPVSALASVGLVLWLIGQWEPVLGEWLADRWQGAVSWLLQAQHDLNRQLADSLQTVQTQPHAAGGLIGLAFLYGILHAIGPGHGKAVVATYLGVSRASARRGMVLALLASLVQGVTAIAGVEIALRLLDLSMRQAQQAMDRLDGASFLLMAVLGVALAWRAGMRLWSMSRRDRQGAYGADACVERGPLGGSRAGLRPLRDATGVPVACNTCGHAHGPQRAHIEQPLSWRSALLVLSIGIRPCTGAVLVLLAAHAMDLSWAGMLAVLAMSLGTAAVVMSVAWLTVATRHGLGWSLRLRVGRRLTVALQGLALLVGFALAVAGLSLAWEAWAVRPVASHPLLG